MGKTINEKNRQLYIAFGQRLKTIREEKGMTLKDVSERANISERHYRYIEKGVSGFGLLMIINLSRALEIEARILVDGL